MPAKKKEEKWIPPFRGLIHVTGEPDTGKTTLVMTVKGVLPEHILFFDADIKTQGLADEFEFAGTPFLAYHNLIQERKDLGLTGKKKPEDYFHMIDALVDKYVDLREKGKIEPRVAIFDGWSPIEAGIRAYSESIMGEISPYSRNQIKTMSRMTWSYTYDEYARFLTKILELAPMVFLTTHTKEKYESPGVLQTRGQRPITEKSTLRIWLRHNPDSPAPIGLVLKRIQKMHVTPDGIVPVSVLPRRIVPCTWDKIHEYFQEPVGLREPTEEETPTLFELSILDGTLTDDQKEALKLARVRAEKDAKEEEGFIAADQEAEDEMRVKIKELAAEGKSLPEIVKFFEGAVEPADVAKALRE